MPCENGLDIFVQHQEDFLDQVYATPTPNCFFNELIPRDSFKHGVGFTRTVFTSGMSLPTNNTPAFVAIDGLDSEGDGLCQTTYNEVEVGFFDRTYHP